MFDCSIWSPIFFTFVVALRLLSNSLHRNLIGWSFTFGIASPAILNLNRSLGFPFFSTTLYFWLQKRKTRQRNRKTCTRVQSILLSKTPANIEAIEQLFSFPCSVSWHGKVKLCHKIVYKLTNDDREMICVCFVYDHDLNIIEIALVEITIECKNMCILYAYDIYRYRSYEYQSIIIMIL